MSDVISKKSIKESHESIRNEEGEYVMYFEQDGWMVWSIEGENGVMIDQVNFCNDEAEDCALLEDDETPEITGDGNALLEREDGTYGHGKVAVPLEIVEKGLKQHTERKTKTQVRAAL